MKCIGKLFQIHICSPASGRIEFWDSVKTYNLIFFYTLDSLDTCQRKKSPKSFSYFILQIIQYPTNNTIPIPQKHVVFCWNTLILLGSLEITCKVMRLNFYIKKRGHTCRANQLWVYILLGFFHLKKKSRFIFMAYLHLCIRSRILVSIKTKVTIIKNGKEQNPERFSNFS